MAVAFFGIADFFTERTFCGRARDLAAVWIFLATAGFARTGFFAITDFFFGPGRLVALATITPAHSNAARRHGGFTCRPPASRDYAAIPRSRLTQARIAL